MKTQSQKEPLIKTLARQLGSAAGIIANATHGLAASAADVVESSVDKSSKGGSPTAKVSRTRPAAKKSKKSRATKISTRDPGEHRIRNPTRVQVQATNTRKATQKRARRQEVS